MVNLQVNLKMALCFLVYLNMITVHIIKENLKMEHIKLDGELLAGQMVINILDILFLGKEEQVKDHLFFQVASYV